MNRKFDESDVWSKQAESAAGSEFEGFDFELGLEFET